MVLNWQNQGEQMVDDLEIRGQEVVEQMVGGQEVVGQIVGGPIVDGYQ